MRKRFSLSNDQTILSAFFSLLNVKHTQSYANKLYNEHPYKYSLFGLSKMLSEYKIKNVGVDMSNKNEGINELEAPFIAHAGNEFILVYEKDDKKISYLWQGKHINIDIDYFKSTWSGVVLLAESNEESIEPDYAQKRKMEWIGRIKNYLLLVIVSSLFIFFCITAETIFNVRMLLIVLTNFVGLYICMLLLMKQVYVESEYADKICSLFKKSDCNNILDSKDAKLWGIVSWSEIGFGYFAANLIIIFVVPYLMSYSVLIGCCALVFSFWSVWYQKVKVKQWCPLCLIVQFLSWLLFIFYLSFSLITMPQFTIGQLFVVGCIYSIPVLVVNLICPKLGLASKMQNIIQQTNSLKMRDEVIVALLKRQPYHKIDRANSQILFGNPQAKIWVTILTNPHCEPCGFMHRRVEKLLDKVCGKICVQYIFSSFNEELESSNKQLIATYLSHTVEEASKIFHDWFIGGKYRKDVFFQHYLQNMEVEKVEEEFDNHNKWKGEAGITATPTILINGYMLSRDYRIEDIIYFVDIEDFQFL